MGKSSIPRKKGARAKEKMRPVDYSILFSCILLVCIGVVMVYSASYYFSQLPPYNDAELYMWKQLRGALVGLVLMIFMMYFDYHKLEKLRYIGLIGSLGLLGLVLIPGVGVSANGATRWLDIAGMSFQPSELAKFALILFTASLLARRKEQVKLFSRVMLPVLIVLGAFCALIYLQPNFSTIICLALLTVVLLFVGGVRLLHLGALGGVAAVGGVYMMLQEGYRENRIFSYLDPWTNKSDGGYQLVQSLYALGAGGLFGVGFGYSKQKMLFLPYRESDFIFSIIGEELGFVGAVAILCLFFFLIWRGVRVALKAPDLFGCLLAAGIVAVITIQVVINVLVVTVTIPPTGVPLPFLSAGGTSVSIFMAAIGILLNISRQTKTA